MARAPAVPVVQLDGGDAAEQLDRALAGGGFCYLVGHGVPPEALSAAFRGLEQLFALPGAEKESLRGAPPLGYAGRGALRLDPTAGQSGADTREQFKCARPGYAADAMGSEAGGGPRGGGGETGAHGLGGAHWPAEARAPGAREALGRYYGLVVALGRRLMALLEGPMGLEAGYFARPGLFDRGLFLLSGNHYSAEASSAEERRFGCGAHTDYGALTILATDEVPGLQVCRDKRRPPAEREWLPVPPRAGALILNCGEMLERFSNGRYNANLHRVVSSGGRERFSLALFFENNADCLVHPLPGCCPPGAPPKFEPVVFSDFLRWKFDVTGESRAPDERAPGELSPSDYRVFREGEADREKLYH